MAQHSKPTWLGWIGQHLILLVFCVGFPGLVTAIVPASWISLQREGIVVRATVKTCVFFVIPVRVQQLEQVVGVGNRVRDGGTSTYRHRGTNKGTQTVRAEDEGFLQLEGLNDSALEVSVSPYSLPTVTERATRFLQDPTAQDLNLFVIANWKFGLGMGGILSLFTLLYVVGIACSIISAIYKTLKSLVSVRRVPQEEVFTIGSSNS